MDELARTLRRLEDNPSPDQWSDIESRSFEISAWGAPSAPAAQIRRSRTRSLVAASVAALLAVGSFVVLTRAFSGPGDAAAPAGLVPPAEAGPPVLIAGLNIGATPPVHIGPRYYLGHVSVVAVWASWCSPCMKAMPKLSALANADPRVRFLGIAAGDVSHLPFIGYVSFPSVMDRSGVLIRAVGAPYLPTYLVLDREGRIRYRLTGGPGLPSGLRDAIHQLMQEPVPPGSILAPSQIAAEGYAAAFISGSQSGWAQEPEYLCPSPPPHHLYRTFALAGYEDAHLTGPPLLGPATGGGGARREARVPFGATKGGVAVSGFVEVTLGRGSGCVIGVRVIGPS